MVLEILEIINGIFVISAGTISSILWSIVLIKKMGHKFIEKKLERRFHILAEFLMSIIAVTSGISLLLEQAWGVPLVYLALGLILYALVNAIGIYDEKGYKLLVIILVVSTIITIALIVVNLSLGLY